MDEHTQKINRDVGILLLCLFGQNDRLKDAFAIAEWGYGENFHDDILARRR